MLYGAQSFVSLITTLNRKRHACTTPNTDLCDDTPTQGEAGEVLITPNRYPWALHKAPNWPPTPQSAPDYKRHSPCPIITGTYRVLTHKTVYPNSCFLNEPVFLQQLIILQTTEVCSFPSQ